MAVLTMVGVTEVEWQWHYKWTTMRGMKTAMPYILVDIPYGIRAKVFLPCPILYSSSRLLFYEVTNYYVTSQLWCWLLSVELLTLSLNS